MKLAGLALIVVICLTLGSVIYSMVTLSSVSEIDGRYQRTACTFEEYRDGDDCEAPLPADFAITPKGKFDRPYQAMEGRPASLVAMTENGEREYISLASDVDVVRIRVSVTQNMTYTHQSGTDRDTTVAIGRGFCRVVAKAVA